MGVRVNSNTLLISDPATLTSIPERLTDDRGLATADWSPSRNATLSPISGKSVDGLVCDGAVLSQFTADQPLPAI